MKKHAYLVLILITYSICAQHSEKYTASFIAEWAGDTAGIETFTIDGNHVYGQALHLYPEPNLKYFDYWYNSDGSIFSMNRQVVRLSDNEVFFREHLLSSNNQAEFWHIFPDTLEHYVHPIERIDFLGGWVPLFCQWEWLTERLVNKNISKNLKFINSHIGVYDLWLTEENDSTVTFHSGITQPITFYLDAQKHIKYIDAIGTPWNYEITRHPPFEVKSFITSFSKKEAMGIPSPHEAISANIHGVSMNFDYGRPSKRGRMIFGSIVPFDAVWRTGAGAVTRWSFDHDLDFSGMVVPAGHYNIYSIPSQDNWTLIFNNEPNAWGSAYRSAYDVYKVKMAVKNLNEIVEKFTVKIEETPVGGTLILQWDDTQAEVDFLIKK